VAPGRIDEREAWPHLIDTQPGFVLAAAEASPL
jgi:hypothetical protein